MRHWKPLLQETESTLCPQHRPPSIATGTGSEPEEAGLEGKTGTLWNILYNKSLLGKPPMGFSLCPKIAEGEMGLFLHPVYGREEVQSLALHPAVDMT